MSASSRPSGCVIVAEEVWGSTLHAARSLAAAGVAVYVATAGQGAAIYGRSRGCVAAADFDAADPVTFSEQVVAWIDAIAPDLAPIVVLPVSDRLVEVLDRARSSFPERFRLAIPTPEVVAALISKPRSFALAARAGLDVPPWVEVTSPDEIGAVDSLRLPVAVRPTAWNQVGDEYFKVEVCRDPSTLHERVRAAVDRGAQLVVQEYVEADETDVEFGILWRSRDRSATVVCTGRKRRQAAPDGGVMVWGEADRIPEVDDGARRFLDASGFTGLGGIEFIRSGGRRWFIEFNPRLEAIHFLAARAGVDTVVLAHEELAWGSTPAAIPRQQPAAAWIGSAWLTRLIEEPGGWRRAIADRVAFARSPRRVRAVWSWSDPGPGLAVGGRLAERAAARVRARLRAAGRSGATPKRPAGHPSTEGTSR